jgi:hypothetical protein
MEKKEMKKDIPFLTKSGGLLSEFGGVRVVLEYRMWIHYHDGKSDEYQTSDNLNVLLRLRKGLLKSKDVALVEQPLAVVWDEKYDDYREVCIDGIKYE